MAEHYKLNLLDIALESFDVKIGFGDDPTITVRNIDIYYAYNSSANFIWYKSYNPNIIATGLSMLFAAQVVDLFEEEDDVYFNNFIFTIYFLVFVFIAKIKIFPKGTRKEQYDRFVKVFWSFYETIFENTNAICDPIIYQRVKEFIFNDVKIFFALYHIFEEIAGYFYIINDDYPEYLKRLLAGDLHHKVHEKYTKTYLEDHENLSKSTTFTAVESKIIDLILPADILIRYLFGDDEGKFISKHILSTLYIPSHLNTLMESFIHSWKNVKECIEYSIEFSPLKKNFFFGLQNYIKEKIRGFKDLKDGKNMASYDNLDNDIDGFLSYLADWDQIEIDSLPWDVHIQTITLDRLVNFYISFVGGFWVARVDSWYIRLHRPLLLRKLLTQYSLFGETSATTLFYAKYFTLYEKNVFYYQYIFNHVRSGKDSFILPNKALIISHESNFFIIQLLNESFRSILLQDINHSDIKLYIKNPEILDIFKNYFLQDISKYIKLGDKELLSILYTPFNNIGLEKSISDTIIEYSDERDIITIKDRMYCLDFRIYKIYSEQITISPIFHGYEAPLLLWLLATLKETLFWFVLYIQYIISCEESHQKNYCSDILIEIYCKCILQSAGVVSDFLQKSIKKIILDYKDILVLWTLLDDNQDYMYIWFNNRNIWIENKDIASLADSLSDEDIIWFLGYLKHISYYNKRFLIPN